MSAFNRLAPASDFGYFTNWLRPTFHPNVICVNEICVNSLCLNNAITVENLLVPTLRPLCGGISTMESNDNAMDMRFLEGIIVPAEGAPRKINLKAEAFDKGFPHCRDLLALSD